MADYHQFCGLAAALDLVGDRWNLLIVRELLVRPRRYAQLHQALPGIASNLLSGRLRDLESAGIIARSHDPSRKAVEYALTDLGADLREAVLALIRWGARALAGGPRPGDTVRGEWVGLAASAFLEPAGGRVEATDTDADRVRLVVSDGSADAVPIAVEGPPAAVLDVVSSALPLERASAFGVRVDDPPALATLVRRGARV